MTIKVSLRTRIYLALLPLLFLFLGLTYYLISDIRALYGDIQNFANKDLGTGQVLNNVEIKLHAISVLIEAKSNDRKSTISDQISELTDGIDRNATLLKKAWSDSNRYETAEKEAAYLQQLHSIHGAIQKGTNTKAHWNRLLEATNDAEAQTKTYRIQFQDRLKSTQERIRKRITNSYVILISGMLLAIILTLFISTFLWRRIVRPIEEISEGMEQLGADNKELKIGYHVKDELGTLARTFERMTARLDQYQTSSNQKLIRRTLALKTILDHSPDAYFIFNQNLEVSYQSPQAVSLMKDSGLDGKFNDAISARLKKTIENKTASFSKELKEAIRIPLNGKDEWFLVHTFPFLLPNAEDLDEESSTSSIAAIFQNVTLLKLSEGLRKNVLATVSHELKTPITSARMSLYLLLEQQLGPLNADQLELVETAKDDVNRQLATIENLLDLSRIENQANQLNIQPFDLNEVVRNSIEAHKDFSNAHDVSIDFQPAEVTTPIDGDGDKIGVAINNYLVNAIKYCGSGKTVHITANVSDAHYRVTVNDNGPGMDEKTLKNIFDAYIRGSSSQGIQGSGLGLNITKDIVEAHGGKVGCSSKLGEGSSFYFEIPIRASNSRDARAQVT